MAHAWKACWVQALGGSNPPSSATGPRDRFRFRGFCCLGRRSCSGRRARPLCVPVGGGPPASRPRCELRSARRLEARPRPATAHQHRGRSLRRPLTGGACSTCGSARRLEAWPGHDAAQRCCRKFSVGQACGDVPCLVAAARVGRKRVCWGPVLRVTVSSEPPQGRNAARIRVRCRVRGGSLYMLLDRGRLQDAFLRCGSGHSS